jgi:predicted alpha/beta hydrolase
VIANVAADGDASVTSRSVSFAAADGVQLKGSWFLPTEGLAPSATAVIVVTCGGGIPAYRYRHLARFLAARGAAVLTYDYRGIGESRRGSLRGFEAGIELWGAQDLAAAFSLARTSFPDLPLGVIAHSVGCLLIGAAPDAVHLSRIVLFGPHTGYWRDYHWRLRWLNYLAWHALMPIVTKIVGYFPGQAFKMGQDLPRGFAMDWSRRRQPEIMVTADDRRRYGQILASYDKVVAPTLSLSVTDDPFAPPVAARRLLANYPKIKALQVSFSPGDLGFRRLGHFAFLRRAHGDVFWERAAAWLLRTELNGRATSQSAIERNVDLAVGSAPHK